MADPDTSKDMRLVVLGASGRMGRTLINAVTETPGVTLHAAIERPDSEHIGADAGLLAGRPALGIPVTSNPLEAIVDAEGVIDFTTPASTVSVAELCAQARIVHVIGTTGFSSDDEAAIAAAARHAVIIRSGNMSLGVNLLGALVQQVARALDADYDIEVLEMHHRHKVDAPSGTALLLGEAASKGRNITFHDNAVRTRDGHTGARNRGDIGFATLRGGSVVGDHTVIFAADGERVELTHKASDRSIYARGALKAALWGYGRKRGEYSMMDVLGLTKSDGEGP